MCQSWRDGSAIKSALTENPESISSTHMMAHIICNSSSRIPLLASADTQVHKWYIDIHAGKRVIHIKQKKKLKIKACFKETVRWLGNNRNRAEE